MAVPVKPELRERHDYIDRTVNNMLEALSAPEVVIGLGHLAVRFTNALLSSFVANLVDSEVTMPADYRQDENSLPVVAIRSEETVRVSSDFANQTRTQRSNTIRHIQTWGPLKLSAPELYGLMIDDQCGDSDTVNISEDMVALTGSHVSILDVKKRLGNEFTSPPASGVTLLKRRPLLILKIFDGTRLATEDIVAHELVHVENLECKPVVTITSQKKADMNELREELQAYHLGAKFSHKRLVVNGVLPEEACDDSGFVQMGVRAIQLKHGIDPYDPYMPSPALLRKLQEHGLGQVLHRQVDYATLVAILDAQAASPF